MHPRRRSAGAGLRSARQALDGVLLGTLSGRPAGFRALARTVDGISDSVLANRLGELGDAGLVARTVTQGPPLSITYPHRRRPALLPALEQITRSAERYLPPSAAKDSEQQPGS